MKKLAEIFASGANDNRAASLAAGAGAPAFDFEAEVKQVWNDFPGSREKVFFFAIPSNQAVFPDDAVRQAKHSFWLEGEGMLPALAENYGKVLKSSCSQPLQNGKSCVFIYTEQDPSMFGWVLPHAHNMTHTFDHELAHALIEDATYKDNPNLAECIADAYATIRHFQRYGADSPTIDSLVPLRAARFVFGKWDNDRGAVHFTSPVVEQILARRHDIDWNSLNPADTCALARRFALEYAPHPVFLDRLGKAFRDCRTDTDPDSVARSEKDRLSALASVLLETADPQALKWGALAFDFFRKEAAAAPELAAARRHIGGRLAAFESRDPLLFGLGAAASTPQKRPPPAARRR